MNKTLIASRCSSSLIARLLVVHFCLAVSACSSTGERAGVFDNALGILGLQRSPPSAPASGDLSDAASKALANPPRKIVLRIHAGSRLNVDANGRSLSVIVKLYELRSRDAFENAPYESFVGAEQSSALAADVVQVREIVLTPGKTYDVVESVGPGAPYFAVVALFRAPAEQRWRFVFETHAAAGSGLALGAHACALSVASGAALDAAPELQRVAGVRCPSS